MACGRVLKLETWVICLFLAASEARSAYRGGVRNEGTKPVNYWHYWIHIDLIFKQDFMVNIILKPVPSTKRFNINILIFSQKRIQALDRVWVNSIKSFFENPLSQSLILYWSVYKRNCILLHSSICLIWDSGLTTISCDVWLCCSSRPVDWTLKHRENIFFLNIFNI